MLRSGVTENKSNCPSLHMWETDVGNMMVVLYGCICNPCNNKYVHTKLGLVAQTDCLNMLRLPCLDQKEQDGNKNVGQS